MGLSEWLEEGLLGSLTTTARCQQVPREQIRGSTSYKSSIALGTFRLSLEAIFKNFVV